MGNDKWTHIRVDKKTKEALESLRQSWVDNEWNDRPQSDLNRWDTHTSLDMVIRVLIERVYDHRQRRAESAKKRGRKRLDKINQQAPV